MADRENEIIIYLRRRLEAAEIFIKNEDMDCPEASPVIWVERTYLYCRKCYLDRSETYYMSDEDEAYSMKDQYDT